MQLASCQKAQRGGVTRGQDPQDGGVGARRGRAGGARNWGHFGGFFTVSQCCCSGGGVAPAAAPTPPQSTEGVKAPGAPPPLTWLRSWDPISGAPPAPNVGGHGQGPGRCPPGTKGMSPGHQRWGENTGGVEGGGLELWVLPGDFWQQHGPTTYGAGGGGSPPGARISFIGVWLHRGSPQARHGVVEHPHSPWGGRGGHTGTAPAASWGSPPSWIWGRGHPPFFPSPAPRPVRQEAMRQQGL